MLRSVPMVHMQVQVPNREAAAVTRCLAREGVLHLVDIAHGRAPGDASPPGTRDLLAAFRDLSHRVRRLSDQLGIELPEPSGRLDQKDEIDFELERKRLASLLVPIEESLDGLLHRLSEARDAAAEAGEVRARARRLDDARIEIDRLQQLRFAAVRLGLVGVEDLSTLASMLAPSPFAIVPAVVEGPTALTAIAVPVTLQDRLDNVLRAVAFEPIPLPPPGHDWTPATLEHRAREAAAGLEAIEAEMETARTAARASLQDLAARAEMSILLLQAQTFFAASGRFVVISGWVPEESAGRLKAAILEATNQEALVEIDRPEDLPEAATGALRVPILYRNPVLLRPFQKLIQLYGTPSYREVEPTAFFGISFLLMFGLMFGDVGHGMVLFSAGYYLYRYIPRFLDYGILLMEGGCASVLFGFLYGSFFGIEDLLPVLWLSPMHDLARFMTVAIGLGIVLVSAGLMLNIVNTWRAGHRAHALSGPRGLFGAFVYWVMLGLLARAFLPQQVIVPTWLLAVMLVAAVVLLAASRPLSRWLGPNGGRARPPTHTPTWLAALEGSVEIVDTLFSYFANTISFVRLAAFAAVHAGVFIAIFALADTLAGMRFGAPLSIVWLIVGNALVILLEGLTVSVQVLRLEYYEFFGKFFLGGGEPYRPLMLRPKGAEGGDHADR